MPERTINWGPDEATAQYQTGEDQATGNFVVAEDTNGGTILLEYDETAGEWVSRGPVNLSGNDLSNVGTVDAAAVNTEDLEIEGLQSRIAVKIGEKTVASTSNEVTYQFTSLSSEKEYILAYNAVPRNSNRTARLTINEDDASGNANYEYWDETGTPNSTADRFNLVTSDGDGWVHTNLINIYATGDLTGIDCDLQIGKPASISTFTTTGAHSGSADLSSVELTFPDGVYGTDGQFVELFEVKKK